MENRLFNDRYQSLLVLAERYELMKDAIHDERTSFQEVINGINRELGEFTHIWGNYIEKCAVESAHSILMNDFDCTTFMSKIKKNIRSDEKPRNQNIEIDFLGQNEDTIFLLEVKSTLRIETMRQIIHNMARLEHFFPYFKGFKVQPIVAYLTSEEDVAEMLYKSGIWLMRPIESDETEPLVQFELFRS
jgi:hypothetical protein